MTPLLSACAVVITLETQQCRKRAPRSVEFNFFLLRQDPLEAILVIFGRRALIFLCLKPLEKNEKWHHFCAHAQWWSPWRRKNVEKGHLAPSNLTFFIKGEVRRKMNFTHVLGFVVLRKVTKVFPVSSSSFVRKTTGRNRARSHSGAWRGLKTKWDLKLSLPSPTYLIRYLYI